jgi:hypothetical protein
VVRWSADTQDALLELVVTQARDAVATFLDRDYVRATLAVIARRAGVAISDRRRRSVTSGRRCGSPHRS